MENKKTYQIYYTADTFAEYLLDLLEEKNEEYYEIPTSLLTSLADYLDDVLVRNLKHSLSSDSYLSYEGKVPRFKILQYLGALMSVIKNSDIKLKIFIYLL